MIGRLMLLTCLAAAPALAQTQPDPNDPPVTLQVKPTQISVNGTVIISGLGYPQPGTQIVVTIKSPAGVSTTMNTVPDKNGNYKLTFAKTPVEGDYEVSATFGSKGAPAKATFSANSYLINIDDDVADNKALLDEASGFVDTVKKAVEDLPDSPAKQEMDAKLTQLQAQTSKFMEYWSNLKTVLDNYKDIISQHPEAGTTLQPLFDHLAQLDDEAKEKKAEIAKEIQSSAKDLQTCDAIDHATIALKAVPDLITIARKPFDFALGFATNIAKANLPQSGGPFVSATAKGARTVSQLGAKNGADAATDAIADNVMEQGSESAIAEKLVEAIPESVRNTDGFKFVVKEIKTRLPGMANGVKSPAEAFSTASKIAGDVIAYANEQLFAKYCEKFEGPFTATMKAYFYSKPDAAGKSIEWWSFGTTIKGTLTLRYPKGSQGKAVALSGQFQGGATAFTYTEDVFNSGLFGKMARGGKVFVKDQAPAPLDDGSGGMTNALVSPTAFFIPVTGQFVDGTITLTMADARADFNLDYVKAHTVYVVVAPTTLNLPIMGHFALPYMPARFVLDHLKADLPVTTSGQTMTAKHVETKKLPGNGNTAIYTIDLKVCNPSCGG